MMLPPSPSARDYRTYRIVRPRNAPLRRVTCAEAVAEADALRQAGAHEDADEIDCSRFRDGFAVRADERTADGQAIAHYLRTGGSGRPYREARGEDSSTLFLFGPEVPCFESHDIRRTLFVVRDGDTTRDLGNTRTFDRGDQWMDSLHETVDRIETIRSRG